MNPATVVARETARGKLAALIPGQLGIDLADEVADAITDAVTSIIESRVCDQLVKEFDADHDNPTTPEMYRHGLRRASRKARLGVGADNDEVGVRQPVAVDEAAPDPVLGFDDLLAASSLGAPHVVAMMAPTPERRIRMSQEHLPTPNALRAVTEIFYTDLFRRTGAENPKEAAIDFVDKHIFAVVEGPARVVDVDHRKKRLLPVQVATVFTAWRVTDPNWDGNAVYTDLATAMDVVAHAYIDSEYPGRPVPEPVTWTLRNGIWWLEDGTGDPLIRITPTAAYGPPGDVR